MGPSDIWDWNQGTCLTACLIILINLSSPRPSYMWHTCPLELSSGKQSGTSPRSTIAGVFWKSGQQQCNIPVLTCETVCICKYGLLCTRRHSEPLSASPFFSMLSYKEPLCLFPIPHLPGAKRWAEEILPSFQYICCSEAVDIVKNK